MDNNRDILKAGLKKSIVNEWKNECHEKEKKEVDIFDINTLSERIYDLPEDLKTLLFMKEIYNLGPKETERIFNIENASDKCKFAELLLALAMNLSESQKISEKSLKKAAEIAFRKYIEQAEAVPVTESALSFEQRKKFRDMGINTHHKAKSALKKAAIIALVSALSLAIAISSSAKLRSEVYKWVVETFPEYSSFLIENDYIENVDFEVLENIKFNYLPENLILKEKTVAEPVVVYQFENKSDYIYLHVRKLENTVNLDTEGISIKEIMIDDKIAYTWTKDDETYLTFEKYNIGFTVISNLSLKNLIEFCANIFI